MSIQTNVEKLRLEIDKIRSTHHIHYPVQIVAVTKTRTSTEVREVIEAGMTQIGENRVQEAEGKFIELSEMSVKKRMIGHLQENKVNKATVLFDTIDSLDSVKTANKLNHKCQELNKIMEVLIEVNTSGEISKNGLSERNIKQFIQDIIHLDHLKLKGFMTIGPLSGDEDAVRSAFQQLYKIRSKMQILFPSLDLKELSMGMSGDYSIAIEEGSTMIRPGTLLFGHRNY